MPCWVEPMTDGDAFMELARTNTQSELSPLERGLHALPAYSNRSMASDWNIPV